MARIKAILDEYGGIPIEVTTSRKILETMIIAHVTMIHLSVGETQNDVTAEFSDCLATSHPTPFFEEANDSAILTVELTPLITIATHLNLLFIQSKIRRGVILTTERFTAEVDQAVLASQMILDKAMPEVGEIILKEVGQGAGE